MTELNFSDKEIRSLQRLAAQKGTSVEQIASDCVTSGMRDLTAGFKTKKAMVTSIRFRKE